MSGRACVRHLRTEHKQPNCCWLLGDSLRLFTLVVKKTTTQLRNPLNNQVQNGRAHCHDITSYVMRSARKKETTQNTFPKETMYPYTIAAGKTHPAAREARGSAEHVGKSDDVCNAILEVTSSRGRETHSTAPDVRSLCLIPAHLVK